MRCQARRSCRPGRSPRYRKPFRQGPVPRPHRRSPRLLTRPWPRVEEGACPAHRGVGPLPSPEAPPPPWQLPRSSPPRQSAGRDRRENKPPPRPRGCASDRGTHPGESLSRSRSGSSVASEAKLVTWSIRNLALSSTVGSMATVGGLDLGSPDPNSRRIPAVEAHGVPPDRCGALPLHLVDDLGDGRRDFSSHFFWSRNRFFQVE